MPRARPGSPCGESYFTFRLVRTVFITVLAYQCVQLLRTRLKEQGIHDSWASLRMILSVQRRLTAIFRQRDSRTLNVCKSTVAEPALLKIYPALGLNPSPGGARKLMV